MKLRIGLMAIVGISFSGLIGGCGLLDFPSVAPTGLTAFPEGGQVTLEWVDNSTEEVGFEIYRAAGPGIFWPYDDVGRNRTTWTDEDVEAGPTYRYKVRALFGEESTFGSAFSNAVSYSWQGITETDDTSTYPAVRVTLDGVQSTVGISNDLFFGETIQLSVSSTAQPRGLREDLRLVAPGITFSVPKNQLDLDAQGGSFLVFPRWDVQDAPSAYVWVSISTRGDPAEFILPYYPAYPDEPVALPASWLAELDDEFGLDAQVTIGVYPVTNVELPGQSGLSPLVINQDFGLFKLNASEVATDTELSDNCEANRAEFDSGRVGREGDWQDIGDRTPLVLVHGWQVLGNHVAGANPFDNFFKESKFAPHVCGWLDFIDAYWLVGAGKLYDLTSKYALYTFSYDSDDHIIENAEELDAYLESAFGDRPAVIVSHSMGGMIASTVARIVDETDQTPSIGNIISFGSPYRGTPALTCIEQAIVEGVRVCSRARVTEDVSGSYVLSTIMGSMSTNHGTVDLASEVGSGRYLTACQEVPGLYVDCSEWVDGIANPFLAELNQVQPDPDTHHSLVGQLDPTEAKCPRWRKFWQVTDRALECASLLLFDTYGYLTDGIVPMPSAYFSEPYAPGEIGVLPHDVFGGVNHEKLHHTTGPLHRAMRLLRDLAHGESGGGELFLTGHTGPITSATFTPDGERIITTSEDATARVWDATSGELLFVADSHSASVNAALVWSDGSTIMTGSSDEYLKQWDAGGEEIWSSNYNIGIYSMDISLTGRYFAVGVGTLMMYMNPRPLVWLIDLDDSSKYKQLGSTALEGFYQDVMFSGDGTLLITALAGVYSGAANIWDTSSGEVFLELEGAYPVRTVAISHDGKRALAVSTIQGHLDVWDVPGHTLSYEIDPSAEVNDAVFSPDGETILLACDDGDVRLYKSATGSLIRSIPTGMLNATVVNISPDGTQVLVGSEAGEVVAFSL